MPRSLRDIRRKMKAVRSTRQVTKAMELVAASKMRRAVQNAQLLKAYSEGAWNILNTVSEGNVGAHPFFTPRSIEKVLIVLVTSDRGLCGSLNTQLCKAAGQYLLHLKHTVSLKNVRFAAVGRKAQQFLARTGADIAAAFPAYSNHPKFKDIRPLSKLVFSSFASGEVDHVVLIYPRFVSPLVQESEVKVLLPFSADELQKLAEQTVTHRSKPSKVLQKEQKGEYVFEPSKNEVFDIVLPQLTEIQIYQAILEACASEHSARMVAMRSASDNASDILDGLTLTYNQTRQANITAELAELSGAQAALG